MKPIALLALLLASTTAAVAAEPAQPDAGQQARPIKALAADHVAGLLAGAGLGYAKAAELNRYPGPLHVLELATELGLSDAQLEATRALRARVVERASALGAELVAAEADLDALFRSGTASQASVAAVLEAIGGIQARLRGVHLDAHLEQRAVLTPQQVDRYVQLRGHGDGHAPGGHHH